MSSAAELALKKKYALLQKRKEAAAGGKTGGGSAAAGSSAARPPVAPRPAAAAQPAAPAATSQDAARQAAIRALQAKRAGAAAGGGALLPTPATLEAPAVKASGTKLKLVIPKREIAPAGGASQQQTAQPPAPTDPARAAALAALRAKAAQQGGSVAAPAQMAQQAQQPQQAQQAEQPKRPAMKRPSARPRPTPQQQLQAAAGSAGAAAAAALDGTFGVEAAQLQQQQMEPLGAYGYASEEQQGGDESQGAKRQRVEREAESGATLFVGDLPQFWGTTELFEFFAAEFTNVLEARVIGSQCYGFVTFTSPEDAEGVLTFAQQQGVWAEDRMLRINWAQGSMPEWKKGPAVYRPMEGEGGPQPVLEAYEHPRVKEARLQAQQLAATVDAQQIQALAMQRPPERQLVSYEDL